MIPNQPIKTAFSTINRDKFFHEAAQQICGNLELKNMAKKCLVYLKDFLPLDGLVVMTYTDEKKMTLRVLTLVSDIPLSVPNDPVIFPLNLFKKFNGKSVFIFNSPHEGPLRVARSLIGKAIGLLDKSSLLLSLEFEGKRLGQIEFFVRGQGRYTKEHARFIEMLHAPFAVAMAHRLQCQEVINVKDLVTKDSKDLREKLYSTSNAAIIGVHGGLKPVMDLVKQVAPLTSPVLLLGETGSGKEVIANAIHKRSARRDAPFISINCGAISDSLIDSELFGHEKGAFTGAIARKPGRFEMADGGTFFLDEVGELPLSAQLRLLRVLQEKEFVRVGGTETKKVDARIIAATNRDMEDLLASGQFRKDLWFRLNVFPIVIPRLSERRIDIPELANYIVLKKSKELNLKKIPEISSKEMNRLLTYDWPGNVREMENVIERAMILHSINVPYTTLEFDMLPEDDKNSSKNFLEPYHEDSVIAPLEDIMRNYIEMVLKQTKGRIQGKRGAAKLLGLNPNTLRHRMGKLGIIYGKRSAR